MTTQADTQKFWVVEIFGPTLQGEGSVAGLRTMFLRLGGCDGADGKRNWCTWCDSMFAVDPVHKSEWRQLTAWEILAEMGTMAPYCHNVTITGGNPALYDLSELLGILNDNGWQVNLETQGTVFRPWMIHLRHLTVSPKPPSAGTTALSSLVLWKYFLQAYSDAIDEAMGDYLPELCLKVVVGGPNDMHFAQSCLLELSGSIQEYAPWTAHLSLLTYPDDTKAQLLARYKFWAEEFAQNKELADFRMLPQLHVLLWEHAKGV